jgi:hypothetical protein
VDINIIFLNLDLKEEIYMEILDFFELVCPNITRENFYIRLRKSLYRLKQILQVWFGKIKKYFLKIRFRGGDLDPNLFIGKKSLYFIIYG